MQQWFRRLRVALLAAFVSSAASAEEITLYTTREAALVKPVTDAFTAATGIAVSTTFIEDNLSTRVAAEGEASPADVLLTIGLDKASQFARHGLTRPLASAVLDAAIPGPLRERSGLWFGVAARPRVVMAARDAALNAIAYEDLAAPEWRGKICMRTLLHQNNVALVAAFLLHHGEAGTLRWLAGLKANLAIPPGGKDNDVIRLIADGRCALGIANTVALAQLRDGREGDDFQRAAERVMAVPTNFRGGGTHVNVTAVGVAKHTRHAAAAQRFVEFLMTDDAQKLFAEAELEYPVTGAARAAIVVAIGAFKTDDLAIDKIAAAQKSAIDLIRETGFTK